ncbi:MAG: hypothetical protein GKS06_05605 [Acidobacteria bacterium]|nr:hypothetical protein [Acidobacteriota bacterium]
MISVHRSSLRASAARFVAVGALVLSVACGQAGSPAGGNTADAPDTANFVRGTMVTGETWQFRACDRDIELPLHAADIVVRNVLDELSAGGGELYVEFNGRVGGRVPAMTMTRLHYAARDTAGCGADALAEEYRAQGNEPFWSVTVEAETVTWRTPEQIDGVEFTLAMRELVGDGLLLRAENVDGQLEASFAATACRDTMADAWFGYTVQVQYEGEVFYGCGRRGRGPR